MPHSRDGSRARLRSPALAATLIVSLAPLACAPRAATPAAESPRQPAPDAVRADSALARLVERERKRPVASARTAPAPPGIDAATVAPLAGDALLLAQTPTDEALAALAALLPDPRPPAPREISEEDADAALRAYIAGRAARLAGDLDEALDLLTESARLNPNPAEPWREMGEIHLARNDRRAAERDFQRAFERNPADPAVLERTALLPAEGASSDAVAGALARLARADADDLDPAMAWLVPAGLGRVLIDRGYAAAGAELLVRGADLPSSFSQATNYREPLSDLYRRRGELLRDAGDALMRLDRPADALAVYDAGAALPLLDPDAMLAHRVAALMRLGQPAAAAASVLQSIDDRTGQIRPLHVALLATIAEHSDTGPAIVEAIEAGAAALSPEVARATHQTRIRAIAALLDPAESRDFLRHAIVAQGADRTLITALYDSLDPATADALTAEAASLIALDPFAADRYVDALLASGPSLAELLAAAQALDPSDARTLLIAHLSMRGGQFQTALAALDAAPPDDCAARLARVRALSALAEHERAAQELDAIDTSVCSGAAEDKAALLADFNRPADALVLLERAEEIPALPDWRHARIALTAARILTAQLRFREAERRYRQVLILDPSNEAAYAGLLALYSQGGPLADETRLLAVVRELRDNAPESRTFRILRARDLIARGRADLAERELEELVERFPDDGGALSMLVRIWTDQDRLDHAEQRLRERLERMPGSRADRVELARILVRSDRARDAATLLEQWLALSPADNQVSSILESVYREALEDPEHAAQLARARLARSPVTIDTLGETAVLHIQELQIEQAVESAQRMIDLSRAQNVSAAAWANRIVTDLSRTVVESRMPMGVPVHLLDILARGVADLSEASHLVRIALLARTEVSADEMIEAADLAIARYPQSVERVYTRLLEGILSGEFLPLGQPVVRKDAPGVVRRPLNAPENAAVNVGDRFALMLPIIAHIRATQVPPQGNLRPGLAVITLIAAVQTTYLEIDGAAAQLGIEVDELLQRGDREAVLAAWARRATDLQDEDGPVAQGVVPKTVLADGAVHLSTLLHNAEDDSRADRLLRWAIELDPTDANANNNLGYRLLERDTDIAEATRLIEVAFKAEPEAANIIDSMGWALYKSGVMHDEFDGDGNFVRAGAITLLRRAVKIVEARNTTSEMFFMRPVLLDHLGDALWAGGLRKEAEEAWRESMRFVESILGPELRRSFSSMPDASFQELERAAEGMRAKLAAVSAGNEPPISRVHAPVNAPPPAGAPEAPEASDTMTNERPLGDQTPE